MAEEVGNPQDGAPNEALRILRSKNFKETLSKVSSSTAKPQATSQPDALERLRSGDFGKTNTKPAEAPAPEDPPFLQAPPQQAAVGGASSITPPTTPPAPTQQPAPAGGPDWSKYQGPNTSLPQELKPVVTDGADEMGDTFLTADTKKNAEAVLFTYRNDFSPQAVRDKAKAKETLEGIEAADAYAKEEMMRVKKEILPQRVNTLRGMEQGFAEDKRAFEEAVAALQAKVPQYQQAVAQDPTQAEAINAQYQQELQGIRSMEDMLKKQASVAQAYAKSVEADRIMAEGYDYLLRSRQGTFGGATWNNLLASFDSANASYLRKLIPAIVRMVPEGALGGMTPEEASKELTASLVPDVGTALGDVAGDKGTTKEYVEKMQETFLGGAWLGGTGSLPLALYGPGGIGMMLSASEGVRKQMDDPSFADIPDWKKDVFADGVGVVIGQLERLGIKEAFGGGTMARRILTNAIDKLPRNATNAQLKAILAAETESAAANFAARIAGSGVSEYGVEAGQAVAEATMMDIFNKAEEKNLLAREDGSKGFDIPASLGELMTDAHRQGLQGMFFGGVVMGTPSAVYKHMQDRSVGKTTNDAQFELTESLLKDKEFVPTMEADLEAKVEAGTITPTQAEETKAAWKEAQTVIAKIPDDLPTDKKREAFDLLTEKQQLSKLDKSMVGDRIMKVDEKLAKVAGVPDVKAETKEWSGKEVEPKAKPSPAPAPAETPAPVAEAKVSTPEISQTSVPESLTQTQPEDGGQADVGNLAWQAPAVGPSVSVAPFYKLKVKDKADADRLSKTPAYKNFEKSIRSTANALGLRLASIDPKLGKFKGGLELSARVEFAPEEDFDAVVDFAALMGALSPESQESTIAAQYLGKDDQRANYIETTIAVDDIDKASLIAESLGIDDFTAGINEGEFVIFTPSNDEQPLANVEALVRKLAQDGIVKEYKHRTIVSEWIGADARRERIKAIGRRDQGGGGRGQGGTELRSLIATAQKRDSDFQELSKLEPIREEYARLRGDQIILHEKGGELPSDRLRKLMGLRKKLTGQIGKQFESWQDLYAESKAEISEFGDRISEEFGAYNIPFSLKLPARAAEKTLDWYFGHPTLLGDGARTTIIVDDLVKADAILDRIKEDYYVVREENYTTDLGYPKRLIEVVTANGRIAEFQVMKPDAYLAKDGVARFPDHKKASASKMLSGIQDQIGAQLPDGVGHLFYEVQRDPNVPKYLRDATVTPSLVYYQAFTDPASMNGRGMEVIDIISDFLSVLEKESVNEGRWAARHWTKNKDLVEAVRSVAKQPAKKAAPKAEEVPTPEAAPNVVEAAKPTATPISFKRDGATPVDKPTIISPVEEIETQSEGKQIKVVGTQYALPGFEEYSMLLHESIGEKGYTVTEMTTGRAIRSAATKAEALKAAQAILNKAGKPKLDTMLGGVTEQNKKLSEKIANLKIDTSKLGGMTFSVPLPVSPKLIAQAINVAIDTVAAGVRAAENLSAALGKARKEFQNNDWYKKLDTAGKQRANAVFRDRVARPITALATDEEKPKKSKVQRQANKATGVTKEKNLITVDERVMIKERLRGLAKAAAQGEAVGAVAGEIYGRRKEREAAAKREEAAAKKAFEAQWRADKSAGRFIQSEMDKAFKAQWEADRKLGEARQEAHAAYIGGVRVGRKQGSSMARNEFSRMVKQAMRSDIMRSRIPRAQQAAIVARAVKVNPADQLKVERFLQYVDNVITKANYADDLAKARKAQKKAVKALKSKTLERNHKEALRALADVDVDGIDDLVEYTAYVNEYADVVKSPASDKYKQLDSRRAIEFAKSLYAQEEKAYVNALLSEFGVESSSAEARAIYEAILSDKTSDEAMQDLAAKAKEKAIMLADRMRTMAVSRSSILNSEIKDGNLDMSGFSDMQKKLVSYLAMAEPSNMSTEAHASYIRAVDNLLVSGSLHGAMRAAVQAKASAATLQAAKLVEGYPVMRLFGKGLAKETMSFSDIFTFFFGGRGGAWDRVQQVMGIGNFYTSKKKWADQVIEVERKMTDFYNNLNKQYSSSNDAPHKIAEFIAATLIQRMPGIGERESVSMNKDLILQDIEKKDGLDGYSKHVTLARSVFDAVFKEAKTIEDVFSSLKKSYPAAEKSVKFMTEVSKQYRELFEQMSELTYNDPGDYTDPNYITRPIMPAPGDPDISDMGGPRVMRKDTIRPTRAKGTIQRQVYWRLPDGYMFNWDLRQAVLKNLSSNLYDAIVAPAQMEVGAFMDSAESKRVFGSKDNVSFVKGQMSSYFKSEFKKLEGLEGVVDKFTNGARNMMVPMALGGITQPIKQYPEAMAQAVIMNGVLSPQRLARAVAANMTGSANGLLNQFAIGSRAGIQGGTNWSGRIATELDAFNAAIANNIVDKASKHYTKAQQIFMWALSKSDAAAAKTAWLALYEKRRNEQGHKVLSWSQEAEMLQRDEQRMQAALYAEGSIDTFMVSSDPAKVAKIAKRDAGFGNFFKAMFFALTGYSFQSLSRKVIDASILWSYTKRTFSGDPSRKYLDTAGALRSQLASITGAAVYGASSILVFQLKDYLAEQFVSIFDDDDEEAALKYIAVLHALYMLRIPVAGDTDVFGSSQIAAANLIKARKAGMTYADYMAANRDDTMSDKLKQTYTRLMLETVGLGVSQEGFNFLVDTINKQYYKALVKAGDRSVMTKKGRPMAYEYWIKDPTNTLIARPSQGWNSAWELGIFGMMMSNAERVDKMLPEYINAFSDDKQAAPAPPTPPRRISRPE